MSFCHSACWVKVAVSWKTSTSLICIENEQSVYNINVYISGMDTQFLNMHRVLKKGLRVITKNPGARLRHKSYNLTKCSRGWAVRAANAPQDIFLFLLQQTARRLWVVIMQFIKNPSSFLSHQLQTHRHCRLTTRPN